MPAIRSAFSFRTLAGTDRVVDRLRCSWLNSFSCFSKFSARFAAALRTFRVRFLFGYFSEDFMAKRTIRWFCVSTFVFALFTASVFSRISFSFWVRT